MTLSEQPISRQRRSEALRHLGLLDPATEPVLERLARLSARALDTPVALVIRAADGALPVVYTPTPDTALDGSVHEWLEQIICRHVVERAATLSHSGIETVDPPEQSMLLALSDLQAILGVPLTTSEGVVVGAVCVAERSPREWSIDDRQALEDLAHLTMSTLESPNPSEGAGEAPQQEQLRESELRKQAIFDVALDSIITIDHEGKIIEFNAAAERTFGYTQEQAIGNLMADLIMPPDQQLPCLNAFVTHLRTGESSVLGKRVERPAMRADGTIIQTEMTVSRIDLPGSDQPIFTAYVRNITEQKQASRDVRFYKHLVDDVAQAIIANKDDENRTITYWNRAAEQLLGWSAEEALGRGFYDLVPAPEFFDEVRAIGMKAWSGETWQGEFLMRRRDGTIIPAIATVAPIHDDDGELLGVTSSYTDATEIKRSEEQIRFYKHIVDAVGESVVASDMDRRITYANRAAEKALGWSIDDVRGKDVRDVVPAEDYWSQSNAIGSEVRESGETWSGEFELRRTDGTTFPALVNLAPIYGDTNEIVGTIGIYTDVADLKAVEQDLRFHKHVVDAVGQAVIANDLEGNITYFNNAAEELLGWSASDVIGRDFLDTVPAESFIADVRELGQQVRAGKSWTGEFLLKTRDGQIIESLSSVCPVIGEHGEIIGVIGAHSDITALKESERAIRLYKHLVDAVGQALVTNDLDRNITYWNKAAEEMLGWSAEEVLGKDFYQVVPADEMIDQVPKIGETVRQGRSWSGEFRLKRKNGETLPVLMKVNPVIDESGETVQIVGAYTDISELKERERDIRFFKHAVDAVGQVVIANDLDRNVTYWNKAAEEILGWSAEEVVGKDAASIAPASEFLPNIPHITGLVRSGKPWTGEFLMQHKDGYVIPALSTIKPILDETGELIGVMGAHTDIRELKRTEQELRFHKHIVDAVGQAVVVSDTSGRITYWNRAAEQIYGWNWDEAIGKLVYELLPADSGQDDAEAITHMIADGSVWSGEFLVRHKDGTIFPAYFTDSPIRDSDGNIVGIIGISHDISDQKAYERQIEFHKVLLDAVGQSVVATDQDRIITYWSKGAEHALGWTADEVLGRPIADFAPAAHLKEKAGTLHRQVLQGNNWSGEFPIRRRDGDTFPAVVNLAPIHIGDNETVGVIGVYTDVTELKDTEREIRFHKNMLDAVGQAVLATDEHLRVSYWNRAAEELYGYTVEEAVGRHLLDFFTPGSVSYNQVVQAIEALSREGVWTGEMIHYHKSGAEISVLTSATSILNDVGKLTGLIATMADITERRRTEEALKESNHKISEILETMGDAFLSVTRNWTIEYVNRQAENILGRAREELLDSKLPDSFPESQVRQFIEHYVTAFETGTAVSFTEYYPPKELWLEVQAFPSEDTLSIFFRDVTERRRNEIAIREAEQRYRTLVEQLPALTYITAPDDVSHILYVSPQITEMLGYTPEEWLANPTFWKRLVHPDDIDYVLSEDARTNASRDTFTIEYRQRTRDGDYRWVRDSATRIRDENGKPTYWQGLSYDITDVKDTDRQIRESEQRFRSLFDHHPDAVFSIDSHGRVLTANPAFTTLTGQDITRIDDLRFVDLVVPEDRDRVHHHFNKTHRGNSQEFRAAIRGSNGNRTELSVTSIPIIVDEEIVGVHVVAQDVTINQELENQLAHQAYHDSLTGLPNRSLFQSRLVARIDQAKRVRDNFAVLFFDIDDFKVINDSLGHSAGDQLLIEVAERVQRCIRTDDLLARLGGDEFTLLLEHVSDERDAIVIAERIAQALEQSFNLDGHEVFVTTSIGIALGDRKSGHSDDILRNADMAMYEAKNAGKNRYALFEPSMNSRAWLRLTMETEIRRGLNRNEFEVYYQPIVDLNTGELDGVEGLVRWNHPERGFLTPKDFITVAEESGLILPLGRWIIDSAAAQLQAWQALTPNGAPLRLNLNLSAKQYQYPRLVSELTAAFNNIQIDPTLITLEITESIAMDESPNTTETLQRLKDIGVQLALDDFGTGFSALSYLRRFPIDIVKIDQSFVDGLGHDPDDTSIVEAVMAASLAMRLRVTAEGIETRGQLDMLRRLGCHFGQGYLISRPMNAREMTRLLEQRDFHWLQYIPNQREENAS